MERFKPEQAEQSMSEAVSELVSELSEVTGESLPVEDVDGTYQIEADRFTLTFTLEDEIIEIRSIDVRGNAGLGKRIINTITGYADEHGFGVIASNVKSSARGFWSAMGFQESENPDEYFKAA